MTRRLSADDVGALYMTLLGRPASTAEVDEQLAATDNWRAIFDMIVASSEYLARRDGPPGSLTATSSEAPGAGVLVATDHRIEQVEDRLVSSVALNGPGLDRGFRLKLRWHGARPDELDASLTPFLPLVAMLASRLGLAARLDGEVDARALDGARRSVRLLAEAYGRDTVALDAAVVSSGQQRAEALRGLFFSRGVDSMSTLVQQRGSIDALLGLDWVEPPFGSDSQRTIWAATDAAADAFGLPLYRFSTNARVVLDPLMSWNDTHGATLISCALLAGRGLSEILISSAHTSATAPQAHGNNRELVESWSTQGTTVTQASAADTRTDKAAIVARDPQAVRWLKVCWEAEGEGNCGVCSKCLLTLTNFESVGALDRVADRFRAPLTLDAVRGLDMSAAKPGSLQVIVDEVALLPAGPLRDAWTAVLPG